MSEFKRRGKDVLATVGDENGERRGELGKESIWGQKAKPRDTWRGNWGWGAGGREYEMPRGPSIGKEWGEPGEGKSG